MTKVVLKPGKEKAVRLGHPWIFSGAIQSAPSGIEAGSEVTLVDHQQRFLAKAMFNPSSSLALRIFSRSEEEALDETFFRNKISQAIALRQTFLGEEQTMARIVASEADYLPGLTIDRYGDRLVFQITTAGMERQRELIIKVLHELFALPHLIERSDEAIRKKEGLSERKALIQGEASRVSCLENGLKFSIDPWEGHKTGFYLDQRTNRAIIRRYAKNKRVLNCFSYTGGFSVAAAAGGACSLVNIDESASALDLARLNLENNDLASVPCEYRREDVFAALRTMRDRGDRFDLIIMDPPKFISDKAHIDRACRGYKDLNLLAMQLLSEGGYLASFSCSGLMSRDLFQKVIFGASCDAGVDLQILEHLSQSEDHPLRLSFPESLYLKGLFGRLVAEKRASR